jgi:hypothetical protein
MNESKKIRKVMEATDLLKKSMNEEDPYAKGTDRVHEFANSLISSGQRLKAMKVSSSNLLSVELEVQNLYHIHVAMQKLCDYLKTK